MLIHYLGNKWIYRDVYEIDVASVMAWIAKNLSAVQEIWVQSLAWEDPLEKGMATHFSILAWKIPWAEEPGRLQSMGLQRIRHNWVTNTFFQEIVVQSLCCVWFFAIPWNAACKASLSFTISQSLLKLMSIEMMMPINHLILSPPSPPALNLSQHQDLFQWVCSSQSGGQSTGASALASVLPMNIQGWIDWLISLLSKGLSSLLQYHSLTASILQHSAFFMVQALKSVHDYWDIVECLRAS